MKHTLTKLGLFVAFLIAMPALALNEIKYSPEVPPQYELTQVGKDMLQDGMQISAWYGRSEYTVERVLSDFQQAWTADERPLVPGEVSDWKTLAYSDHPYFITLQVRPSQAARAEFTLSVMDTRTVGKGDISDFIRPPRAEQLSILRSNDDGVSSEVTVFSDESSLQTVLDFYKLHLPSNGWQIKMITTDPEALEAHDYMLHINKENRAGQVALSRRQAGSTTITVNIAEAF